MIKIETAFVNEQEFFRLNFPNSFSSLANELEKLFLKSVVVNLKAKATNEDDGLPWMLMNGRNESIKCLYRIFKLLEDYFDEIRQAYRKYVESTISNFLVENSSDLKGKSHSKVKISSFSVSLKPTLICFFWSLRWPFKWTA